MLRYLKIIVLSLTVGFTASVSAQSRVHLKVYEGTSIIQLYLQNDSAILIGCDTFPLTGILGFSNTFNCDSLISDSAWYASQYSLIVDTLAIDIDSILAVLDSFQFVERVYAEPNIQLRVYSDDILPPSTAIQNKNQWYMYNIDALAGAYKVHNEIPQDKRIGVAVIDVGFYKEHEDLWSNISGYSRNYAPASFPGETPNQFDPNGLSNGYETYFRHGNMVAGLISPITNNGEGIAGISYNHIDIVAYRVGYFSGGGVQLDLTAIKNSLKDIHDHAQERNIRILNLSFGAYIDLNNPQQISAFVELSELILMIQRKGIIVVVAAGNEGREMTSSDSEFNWPAEMQGVISVGASDENDALSTNWPGNGMSDYGEISILAPGSNIYTTSTWSLNSNSLYSMQNGTSLSAPLVSATLGLMMLYSPGLEVEQYVGCLLNGADNVDQQNPGYIGKIGAGRLNISEAIKCIGQYSSVDFAINKSLVCEGKDVFLYPDFSGNPNASFVSWQFSATPDNVNVNSEGITIIRYQTPGVYDISMTFIENGVTKTVTKNAILQVSTQVSNYGIHTDDNYVFPDQQALNWAGSEFVHRRTKILTDPLVTFASHHEGNASISSSNGHLLLYTDGFSIYNHVETKVKDSDGNEFLLGSGYSNTQNALFVPYFENCSDRYILFYFDENKQLRYCIIDLGLDSGRGMVLDLNPLPGIKEYSIAITNSFDFPDGCSEKLTATFGCEFDVVWVAYHKLGSDELYTTPVKKTISGTKVEIGLTVQSSIGISYIAANGMGVLKFSPDGSKAVFCDPEAGIGNYLLDFNRSTGQFSNPVKIDGGDYGCEFSPDAEYVYTSRMTKRTELATLQVTNHPTLNGNALNHTKDYTLGPDGNIYFIVAEDGPVWKLAKITDPSGSSPQYTVTPTMAEEIFDCAMNLNNSFIQRNWNYYKVTGQTPLTTVLNFCEGEIINEILDPGPAFGCYNWSTGATSQTITVTSPGLYSVSVCDPVNGCEFVIEFELIVHQTSNTEQVVCTEGFPHVLAVPSGYSGYVWTNGPTTQTVNINVPGLYICSATDAFGCINLYEFNVEVYQGDPDPQEHYYFCVPPEDGIAIPPSNCFEVGGVYDIFIDGVYHSTMNEILTEYNPGTWPIGTTVVELITRGTSGCECTTTYYFHILEDMYEELPITVCEDGFVVIDPSEHLCIEQDLFVDIPTLGENAVYTLYGTKFLIDLSINDLQSGSEIIFTSPRENGCVCSVKYVLTIIPQEQSGNLVSEIIVPEEILLCDDTPMFNPMDYMAVSCPGFVRWTDAAGNILHQYITSSEIPFLTEIPLDGVPREYVMEVFDENGCLLCKYIFNIEAVPSFPEITDGSLATYFTTITPCDVEQGIISPWSPCGFEPGYKYSWFKEGENGLTQKIKGPTLYPWLNKYHVVPLLGANEILYRVTYSEDGCIVCVEKVVAVLEVEDINIEFCINDFKDAGDYWCIDANSVGNYSFINTHISGGVVCVAAWTLDGQNTYHFPYFINASGEMCFSRADVNQIIGSILEIRLRCIWNGCLISNVDFVFRIENCPDRVVNQEQNSGKEGSASHTVPIPNTTESPSAQQQIFQVYPNPSQGSFTVQSKSEVTHLSFVVYDALGREVHFSIRELGSNRFEIVLNNAVEGIYFLSIQASEATLVRKLVIQR